MTYPYDASTLAAILRLNSYYNGSDYDPGTNPGGMGLGGHRVNFNPALVDLALTLASGADAADAAATSASTATTQATNASASAAKLQGTSTTSRSIGTGSKAFTTQAGKFFDVGTFLLIYSAANPTANYMAGQVTAYSGTSLTVDATVTLGSGTFTDWVIAVAGSPGARGLTGDTGVIGPTPDVMFTFSNGTTDSDPGNGLLKLNNAAPSSTTYLYVDILDRYGTDISVWLDAMDDSTNTTNRGSIKLVQVSDPSKIAVFDVTGVIINGTGYRKIPVTPVFANGTFTNAAILAFGFTRTGNKGADGIGAGDVIGPAGVTDSHVALFDGSTGKLLRSGGALATIATSGSASDLSNTPAGNIAATNVQAALNELDTEKAPLASPALTGTPTAPTASAGTNTTQLATTAFVTGGLSGKADLASPALTGTPTAPTASPSTSTTQLATTAFVTGGLSSKADLASPALTGTPTAPTAVTGTNTTQIATAALVKAAGDLKANLVGANAFSGGAHVHDATAPIFIGTAGVSGGFGLPRLQVFGSSGNYAASLWGADDSSLPYHVFWLTTTGQVGSIAGNGASGINYNTASDYRLKLDAADLVGSGAFIDALRPRSWVWATDGKPGTGFIAHEVADVSPSSVTGEKDAVDGSGRPIYQGMQASSSEIIAHMVAELQSLRARVAALEGA